MRRRIENDSFWNFAANGGKNFCINFLMYSKTMDRAGTATRRNPDKPRDHLDVFREFIDHRAQRAPCYGGCARQTPAGQLPLAGSLPTVVAGPAPAIREEFDQTLFKGPRTGSAGDGPILFPRPAPSMLSLHSEPTIASAFAPRTTIDADGTVEGYASLFGEIDQARDMAMRGVSTDTLASRGIRRIPMLFQHDPAEPVGIWLEVRKDFARSHVVGSFLKWREDASSSRCCGRSLGRFHRDFPAAYGSARARGEACDLKGETVLRPHACRAGVGEDNRRPTPAVN